MKLIDIPWRAPLDAFAPLDGTAHAHLLQAGRQAEDGDWSYIAAFPASVIEARRGVAYIDGRRRDDPPFQALADFQRARRLSGDAPTPSGGAPFCSGLIGYVGYEAGAYLEPTARGPASPYGLPDVAFGAYDAVAIFDHGRKKAQIAARDDASWRELADALDGDGSSASALPAFADLQSNFTAAAYRDAVAAVIERIRDGEFFQANISQKLTATNAAISPPASAISLFGAIVEESSAAFCALLQYPDGAVLSNSPERFFQITTEENRARIIADPIKGTRPRGKTPAEDRRLAEALLADPKDRAENIMIADLMRNDLSRICRDGTVNEDFICALASHAAVHHMVSRISGELRSDIGPVEAMSALFPCGSITGAPKIQAMKAIGETEGVGRGPYCGAIGYIDDRGGAEFSVAIRTATLTGRGGTETISIPVGGGITIRSDPAAEYEETLVKAKTILAALGLEGAALG